MLPKFRVTIEYAAAHPWLGVLIGAMPFDGLRSVTDPFQRTLGIAYMLSIYYRLLETRFGAVVGTQARALREQYAHRYLGERAPDIIAMTHFVEQRRARAIASRYDVLGSEELLVPVEYLLGLVALVLAPGAPYAHLQHAAERHIPHDVEDALTSVLVAAGDRAMKAFEPLIEFMFIRGVAKPSRDWNTEDRDGQTILAGRYERHLRRRRGNPLFPLVSQDVSREELAEARMADRRLMLNERNAVWHLLGEITASERQDTTIETRLLDALRRVYEVGGNLSDEQLALDWMLGVTRSEQGVPHPPPGSTHLADRVARGPWAARQFAAQLLGKNSPIAPTEVAASLFCEKTDTIAWCVRELFPRDTSRKRLRDEVAIICQRILMAGGTLGAYRRQLRALGFGWWDVVYLRVRLFVRSIGVQRAINHMRLVSANAMEDSEALANLISGRS